MDPFSRDIEDAALNDDGERHGRLVFLEGLGFDHGTKASGASYAIVASFA